MDWRILAAISVLTWGGYNFVLKAVSARLAWQVSMAWFLTGYVVIVGTYTAWHLVRGKTRFFQVDSGWSLLAGVLCGLGAMAFFKAITLAPGSTVLPLVGLNIVVAALACLIFLHEPLSARLVAGILCAGAAVILLGR